MKLGEYNKISMEKIDKSKLEYIDEIFENNVWIDKNYKYDPLYRYKKFYIISKYGNVKRYGVNKIIGTSAVNTADFILFAQKSGDFTIKNVNFHHGTNFVNKYDPIFFYFDREKKQYMHLKYNQVYKEEDIENLYSYSYVADTKTLYIRENDRVIKQFKDIYYYEFNDKKPIWGMFSKKTLNGKGFEYYEYDFSLNREILIGIGQEYRFYNDRYKIYDFLKEIKSSGKLYDKNQVYFYISATESVDFRIIYNYAKEYCNIEIIDNEFEDDTTINYKISCDINNKKQLQFLYWMIKVKDINEISIYNYPIKEIIKSLDYNIDILKKINKKVISDYSDKQKIIEKLKEKYVVKKDEDLLIKLAQTYGKELLLPVVGIDQNSQKYYDIFMEVADNEKYQEIYSQVISSGVIINRWKSEINLFRLIKTYFPDAIYQYHAKFLGKQSIDIFIPSLNVGVEYQGRQHYEAVDFFGGEERLREQLERDNRKKELCSKNKIVLIEWGYYEEIIKDVLEQKLKSANISIEILKNKIGIES